jgi:putative protease
MAKKVKKKKVLSKSKKVISKKKKIAKNKKANRPIAKKTRKPIKKTKASAPSPTAGLEVIGEITHYFPHVNAGVIKLHKTLSVGEQIYIKGYTTDFKEKVESLQIERVPVKSAKPKEEVGILVKQRVRAGDKVYRL